MLELFPFQNQAAAQVCDRYLEYAGSPVPFAQRGKPIRRVPFYQALSALTGAGKTAILAASVAQIAESMDVAPVVLWLSKGKVVVDQSYANLIDGGKYRHLLGNSEVRELSAYKPLDVASAKDALVYFATVGSFNQRDKATSNLRVHTSNVDTIGTSAWTALKNRADSEGTRRPLLVVYDEAQNLSDQQTDLLLELDPDGFLLASATLRFPEAFHAQVIAPLRGAGYDDEWLTTSINSSAVVNSGLVKSQIVMAGYQTPMEETINDMIADLKEAEADARSEGVDFLPKAIYVANTNQLATDGKRSDDPSQPFSERQAPPILIWRHLTEVAKIPAAEIAVYAALRTDSSYPLPPEFNLFNGGDKDYANFEAGNYRHIIFNLALQEGWDDPAVYFAYIDRSMESTVQITQVIGRVLRQPGAKRYVAPRLNTASFYVRVDQNSTFDGVLADVKKNLGGAAPEIQIVATPPGKKRVEELAPKYDLTVPKAALDNRDAVEALRKSLASMPDFSDDATNTVGDGQRRVVKRTLGSETIVDDGWRNTGASSQVSARWVFRREISREFPPAQTTLDTTGKKFDAMVGIGSVAFAQVAKAAHEAVGAYLENVYLKQQRLNEYHVPAVLVDPGKVVRFSNAVHEGYDGLNNLELQFANALDELDLRWARNLPRVGYGIPLVSTGDTNVFYPDFLVWTDSAVLLIDTKGNFLLLGDAARKLLTIAQKEGASRRLDVRFVSTGHWSKEHERQSGEGFTLWGLSAGQKLRTQHFDTLTELAQFVARP